MRKLNLTFTILTLFGLFLAACATSGTPSPASQAAPVATKQPTTAPITEATEVLPNTGSNTPSGASAATPGSAAAHTYTVMVGWNDSTLGAELEAYFPAELHIHTGDTVTWKTNTPEIHTVTFMAGQSTTEEFLIPVQGVKPGEMMFNPKAAFPDAPKDGKYDGSTYANSGIMGIGPNQTKEFSLTFTKAGTYAYICVVHGMNVMAGKIVVEPDSTKVDTPEQANAQGQTELDALKAKIPDIVSAARAALKPDKKNEDGSTTRYVLTGYSQGQIDLMAFFPNKLQVKPGDTVEWYLPEQDMAPHTITFLNGAEEPELTVQKPQTSGQPQLEFSPEVAQPQNADKPLGGQGIYNSGLIDPHAPGSHTFVLTIDKTASGTLPYICLLHDESGMKGELDVTQ